MIWKKLRYWKIGPAIYEVTFHKNIPEKIREGKDEEAFVDMKEKKIHIQTEGKSWFTVMEDLFHEIEHVIDFVIQDDILDRQRDAEEIRVELRSLRRLELMMDNTKQHMEILKFFELQKKKLDNNR